MGGVKTAPTYWTNRSSRPPAGAPAASSANRRYRRKSTGKSTGKTVDDLLNEATANRFNKAKGYVIPKGYKTVGGRNVNGIARKADRWHRKINKSMDRLDRAGEDLRVNNEQYMNAFAGVDNGTDQSAVDSLLKNMGYKPQKRAETPDELLRQMGYPAAAK